MLANLSRGQWLAQRMGRVTASEVYRLMKVPRPKSKVWSESALSYLDELLVECVATELPKEWQNAAMVHGHNTEPEAAQAWLWSNGLEVKEADFIADGLFGASPDVMGWSVEGDGPIVDRGCQIKCPQKAEIHVANCRIDHFFDLPDNVYWQVLAELHLSGASSWDWLSYCDRWTPQPMHSVRLNRGEIGEELDALLVRVKEFLKLYETEAHRWGIDLDRVRSGEHAQSLIERLENV